MKTRDILFITFFTVVMFFLIFKCNGFSQDKPVPMPIFESISTSNESYIEHNNTRSSINIDNPIECIDKFYNLLKENKITLLEFKFLVNGLINLIEIETIYTE